MVVEAELEVGAFKDTSHVAQGEDQHDSHDRKCTNRCHTHRSPNLEREPRLKARVLADSLSVKPIIDRWEHDCRQHEEVAAEEHESEEEITKVVGHIVSVRLRVEVTSIIDPVDGLNVNDRRSVSLADDFLQG